MEFLDNGYLPQGVHQMTWAEFYNVFNFSPKRKVLLAGLEKAIDILRQCGCTAIYINGSFVTEKLEPNDYDACWEGDMESVCSKLSKIEPVFLDFTDGRKNQKLKYNGEIFPSIIPADPTGISYLDFFQQIRFSKFKKGIVLINL